MDGQLSILGIIWYLYNYDKLFLFISALYGCIFPKETEIAFSNNRLWEALGLVLAFSYSSCLCTYIKLYILMSFLLVGISGLFIVEKMERNLALRTL